jgi:putative membrane protein
MWHWDDMHGWWDGGWHMGWLWLRLVLVIVVLAVLASRSQRGNRPTERTALDILKERYAKGEIDHDEFQARKRDLEG